MLTNTFTGISLDNFIHAFGEDVGRAYYYASSVQREYLGNAFDIMDKEYGGAVNYIRNELGVDIEKLKDIFLY